MFRNHSASRTPHPAPRFPHPAPRTPLPAPRTPHLGALLLVGALATAPIMAEDWRGFRNGGPSVTSDRQPPLSWNLESGENVAWRIDLPGKGPASPIVVGDKVIVTASGGAEQERLFVLCFAADSGKELWRREFWATGRTASHPTSGNAAPTPASDGERVFAFFSSNDLICLDLDGNLQWYRGLAFDFPQAGNDIGMSSSPFVVDGAVVVQVENQGDSFAAAIEAETGQTRWQVKRLAAANWCSPTAIPAANGRPPIVLLQSTDGMTAHDVRTGAELWKYPVACQGIASSVAEAGRVYLPAEGLTALDIASSGEPKKLWSSAQLAPASPSPVLYKGRLYTINGSGVLGCGDAATGEPAWSEKLRLGGRFWGTPIAVNDHLYGCNSDGKAMIVLLGEKEGKVVFESDFGEIIQASPAVASGALYFRSDKHLWKIAAK